LWRRWESAACSVAGGMVKAVAGGMSLPLSAGLDERLSPFVAAA
jgi:hypothetical protein